MLSTPKAKAELFLASSLYDGLEDNNIMQVTTLLLNKEADPNVLIPSQGITPFHLVIGNDSETFAEEVTKLFLRHGGNPNVKSVDGMTPVHVAAAWGRLGVLELLLSNGGDPLLVDDDGRCPFHYAFEEAHYDAVATLGKHCGETFEEDLDLKYNIALDKVLVSNGGIVGEYEVSDETNANATAVGDVPAIPMSKVSNNNNNLLENLNKRPAPLVKAENHVPERSTRYLANIDSTLTTTADESSATLEKFVNTRRHQRCLPQKNPKRIACKLENGDEFNRVQGDLRKRDAPAWCSDRDNLNGISHLNDPMIEASFLVQPRKIGENMPRISSPKANKKPTKLERDPGTECRDVGSSKTTPRDNKMTSEKNKFIHKTPLRCSTRRGPLAETKKTPVSTSAKKTYTFNGRTTPKSGTISSNDKAIRTPGTYICKQTPYLPDCSIVSKSPNLIITREDRKITIGRLIRGTPGKDSKRIPTCGSGYKTPTPDKICSNVTSGRNFSRFVKQSDLRHQGTKRTPISSPSKFRDSPTWSKKSPRTPNLTDSTKQKRKLSTGKTKTVFTPSHSTAHSPATPLNKTYSKSKYFDPSGLSPDVENTNRFVDRRTMAKHIAIKLEESMYDDDCDKNMIVSNREMTTTPKTVTPAKGIGTTESSVATETDVSNIIDNRRHRIDVKIHFDNLTSDKRVEVSGLNTITDSNKNSRAEAKGVCLSRSNIGARFSNIIAGFFQPSDVTSSSARTSNAGEILNNAILRGISGRYSNMPTANISRARNLINCFHNETEISTDSMMIAAGLKRPNSKEIDDSLVSSESSSYFQDCDHQDSKRSSNLGETNLLMEKNELMQYGSAPGGNESTSELPVPRLTGGNCLTDMRKTCSVFPNISSSGDNSSYMSFVSVEEEYKYEDAEEGVVLLERRLLVTPVSIPIIKAENEVPSPSENISRRSDDESMESRVSSLPHSLLIMDGETLRRELTKLDHRPPGPITATTRHVYLKRLRKLQKHGPAPASLPIAIPPKFSTEIERTLRSESWINDLSAHQTLEQQVFNEFSNPDPTRRWREGTTKSSFNYILMDPRITDNLPRRADKLSPIEQWRTFLASIFYVGKGRRSRPYAHLYEAYGEWKKEKKETSDKKINAILDIWKSNRGVVCLHLFQNTIPVEAYTREAAMIEALGLERLKNLKSGDYYGVASTWSHHQKRTLGVYLLYKAMHILINEGERQLSPDDIGR